MTKMFITTTYCVTRRKSCTSLEQLGEPGRKCTKLCNKVFAEVVSRTNQDEYPKEEISMLIKYNF